jgi:transcriptional regulator of aromatic amino acid metabolism
MKAGFLEKLIERLGRIGPEEVQNYFLRLAQEKGFLETVFNAIHEGIIVTDSNGRVTYLNDAACKLFGLEAADAIGKRLDERVRGLDWGSLTQSGEPLSRDMEIFYPENRFINFYIVPLVIEPRDSTVAAVADRGRSNEDGGQKPRTASAATAPLWQREFFDHLLRSEESYDQKWNYVRDNPVRAGLVLNASEWSFAGEIDHLRL